MTSSDKKNSKERDNVVCGKIGFYAMDKSANSKRKDLLRTAGKHFVRVPSTWDERVTASGVTFGGRYIRDKKMKRVKRNRG